MRLRSQAAKTRAFHARNAGFDSRRSHQETKFLYNNSGKCRLCGDSLDKQRISKVGSKNHTCVASEVKMCGWSPKTCNY